MIELNGTPNKGKLGANAIIGVSIAVAPALLTDYLNVPLYQILRWLQYESITKHQWWTLSMVVLTLTRQSLSRIHDLASRRTKLQRSTSLGSEIFHELKSILHKRRFSNCSWYWRWFSSNFWRDWRWRRNYLRSYQERWKKLEPIKMYS